MKETLENHITEEELEDLKEAEQESKRSKTKYGDKL